MITSTGGDGRTYLLVHDHGEQAPIKVGEVVASMRGLHTVTGGRAPQHGGSTGRVWTDKGEYFPSVVCARWIEHVGA